MPGRLLAMLKADRKGSVVAEFALLIPVLLGLMLGIMQVGIGMQNYNALRSISADTARYAVVDAQANVARRTDTELQDWAMNRGAGPIYHLHRADLAVTIGEPDEADRIPGARERKMVITYRIDSVLAFIGVGDIQLRYERPIFLTV